MRICPECSRENEGFPMICSYCGAEFPEPEIQDPFAEPEQPAAITPVKVMRYRGNKEESEKTAEQPAFPVPDAAESAQEPKKRRHRALPFLLVLLVAVIGVFIAQYLLRDRTLRNPASEWVCYQSGGTLYYWDKDAGAIPMTEAGDATDSLQYSTLKNGSIQRSESREYLFYPEFGNAADATGFTLCRRNLKKASEPLEKIAPGDDSDEFLSGKCIDYRLLDKSGSNIVLLFRIFGKDYVYQYESGEYRMLGQFPLGSVTLLNCDENMSGTAYYLVSDEKYPVSDDETVFREKDTFAGMPDNTVSEENLSKFATFSLYQDSSCIRSRILTFSYPFWTGRYFFCTACGEADDSGTSLYRYDLSQPEVGPKQYVLDDLFLVQTVLYGYQNGSCYVFFNANEPEQADAVGYWSADGRMSYPHGRMYARREYNDADYQAVSVEPADPGQTAALIVNYEDGITELFVQDELWVMPSAWSFSFAGETNTRKNVVIRREWEDADGYDNEPVCIALSCANLRVGADSLEFEPLAVSGSKAGIASDSDGTPFCVPSEKSYSLLQAAGRDYIIVLDQNSDGLESVYWKGTEMIGPGTILDAAFAKNKSRAYLLVREAGSEDEYLYCLSPDAPCELCAENVRDFCFLEDNSTLFTIESDGSLYRSDVQKTKIADNAEEIFVCAYSADPGVIY